MKTAEDVELSEAQIAVPLAGGGVLVSSGEIYRPGKIMRRVIAGISNFTSPGDIMTLANPEIAETIRQHVQSEKVKRGELPRELSPQELEEIKKFGQAE